MAYKTILSEKKSTTGSPYCFYTVQYEEKSRTASTVTLNIKILAHLQYSESYSGWAMNAILTVGGTAFTIPLKGTETWSGTTTHTITKSITVSAAASVTSLTAYLKVDNLNTTASELSSIKCTNITISKYYTAASIAATAGKIGDTITYTLSGKYPNDATCDVTYSFGSISGEIASGALANGSHSWNTASIADNLLAQIPNSKSGSCTLSCVTKYGGTTVGTKTCTFTLSTDESVSIEEGSLMVQPYNENHFLADKSIFVAGYSKAIPNVTATAGRGASIKSTQFSFLKKSGSSVFWAEDSLLAADVTAIVAKVTDSRGTTATATKEISAVDYKIPTAFLSVERGTYTSDEETASWVSAPSGKNLKISVRYSISLREYGNAPTFSILVDNNPLKAEATALLEDNTESSEFICYYSDVLSSETAHEIKVTVTDSLGNSSIEAIFDLPTEVVNMSFKANNDGVTFGAHPEESGFINHFPAKFYKEVSIDPAANGFPAEFLVNYEEGTISLARLLLDFAHPVGSYYWSSNAITPALLFGGTWEQVTDKFLLAAGTTYAVGSTGGEASHTLTTTEIPGHTHGSKSLTGYAGDIMTDYGNEAANGTNSLYNSGILSWTDNAARKRDFTGNGNYRGLKRLNINATHEHTSVGGDGAHNNMPPYIAAYCWKRTS